MKALLGFVEVAGGIAFILLLVRAGYGVIASDVQSGAEPPDFAGLVRPYLIFAGLTLAVSIGAGQIKKRM
ncbi:hypothetical protein [uncultured Tateyamaria sp.]|uniref:hypothetical protein n=1 Tax=Tateyamaria sp. 1078 TaxID=3417464 RepID=UPI00260E9CD8|nr:hypothetical protein [uncultured Tateyamaria sp.]